MIKSFACAEAENIFNLKSSKRFKNIETTALRKLVLLDYVIKLDELRVPPGNRLEALSGNRQGQHSIRINEQWRICFEWRTDGVFNVEIVDYH